MPTRMFADVGDHSCFLIMIPIDCKLTIFPYTCKEKIKKIQVKSDMTRMKNKAASSGLLLQQVHYAF